MRSNRYWVRDVLYPRLHESTLLEYAAMLRAGDSIEAKRIAATATEMAEIMARPGGDGACSSCSATLGCCEWSRRRCGSFRRVGARGQAPGRVVMEMAGVRLPPG